LLSDDPDDIGLSLASSLDDNEAAGFQLTQGFPQTMGGDLQESAQGLLFGEAAAASIKEFEQIMGGFGLDRDGVV